MLCTYWHQLCACLLPRAPAALAQAFASIGSCTPRLLDAFAERAMALGQQGRLDVQVGASQTLHGGQLGPPLLIIVEQVPLCQAGKWLLAGWGAWTCRWVACLAD